MNYHFSETTQKANAAHRLLILSCSQRKRPGPGLLPAIARYDGPAFRVLRKFCEEEPLQAQTLETYVLSAKFGLIPTDYAIPCYDQRITDARIKILRELVVQQMQQVLLRKRYTELFLNLGSEYLQAIEGYEQLITPDIEVMMSAGTSGRKLTNLRDWLYANEAPPMKSPSLRPGKSVILRGIFIRVTMAQILEVARRGVMEGRGRPGNYQSWYVVVDEKRVAPKWLVGQLSGLPVSDFHTSEAIRVLQQLGIEVKRT